MPVSAKSNAQAVQGSLLAKLFCDYCAIVQVRQYMSRMEDKFEYDPQVAKTFIHLLLAKQLDMQERTLSYIFLCNRVPVSVLEEIWKKDFIVLRDNSESLNVMLRTGSHNRGRDNHIRQLMSSHASRFNKVSSSPSALPTRTTKTPNTAKHST